MWLSSYKSTYSVLFSFIVSYNTAINKFVLLVYKKCIDKIEVSDERMGSVELSLGV